MDHLLWKGEVPFSKLEGNDFSPSITPYPADRQDQHGAVIICPGGGYQHRANHEGEPIARWLNSLGISAYVLNYRVAPFKHPAPLVDVQRAIRYVRSNAEDWNLDKHKIGLLGFSAGGHLASTAATYHDMGDLDSNDKIECECSRPDFSILCYPVISFVRHYHEGSILNLLGENSSEQLRVSLSSEHHVSTTTPATFLWHTADDASVPVENSLLYAQALSKHDVPYEMHIFPKGRHGLGLAEDDPVVSQWTILCENWLRNQGF